nr:uncharacterized protein LOC121120042 [Lepeophtheirus salmonis]
MKFVQFSKNYPIPDPEILSNRTKTLEINVDDLFKEFGDFLDDGIMLKPIKCDPVKIILQENAEPFCMRKKCVFDPSWEGRWFEYGERDGVRIGKDNITHKGTCLFKDGEKYIFQDENKGCLRCAVMHQKHSNVIQYKESFCVSGYENYPINLCYDIKTDEPLKSLFRLDAEPIPCPIRGSFQFEYSRGHGLCDYPISSISQCSDKSKLIFRNQACADIKGSESSVEELKCLADWKEGSTYYFLGLMNVSHVQSDNYEGRFRCFVYESIHKGFFLSQSGEAKCNLYTAREGAKTMKLKKIHNHQQQCEIPGWILQYHHQFQDLSYSSTYHFNKKGTSLTISSSLSSEDRRLKCNTVDMDTGNKTRIIMQVSFECENGYMCMEIEKKYSNILQLRMGRLSRNPDEACHQQLFFDSSIQPTLLIGSGHGHSRCPLVGKYRPINSLSKIPCSNRDDYLISGCSGGSSLEVMKTCGEQDGFESYVCQGVWNIGAGNEDSRKTYFILSSSVRGSAKKGSQRLCALLLTGSGSASSLTNINDHMNRHNYVNNNTTHHQQDRIRLLASSNSCPDEMDITMNPSTRGEKIWDLNLERTSHCAQALATANTNAGSSYHYANHSRLTFFLCLFLYINIIIQPF